MPAFSMNRSAAIAALSFLCCSMAYAAEPDFKSEPSTAARTRYGAGNLTNWAAWMDALPDEATLARISIPGTHDSGTFKLRGPVKQVWAMTQDRTFDEQMAQGVRFFDLRARATSDTHLVLHHGSVYLYATLWEFIDTAKRFLWAHPSETIIMSLKYEYKPMPGVSKKFEDIFADHYLPDDIFYKGSSANPTLGETRGKIVLFRRYGSNRNEPGFGYSGWDDNKHFYRSINGGAILLHVQDKYNVSYAEKDASTRIFFNLTDGRAEYSQFIFINFISLSSGGTRWSSPYYYASYLNPAKAAYIEKNIRKRAGWVVMDYAGNEWQPALYQQVILSNRSLVKADRESSAGLLASPFDPASRPRTQ